MSDVDLQSEQFMTLLTDALRAGPGSPEWHQAVRILRATNQNVDEYTLLYSAREDLEGGKSYRTVRAGPGFTKKLLDGIDEQSGRRASGLPTATLIAIVAGLVIVGVVVAVIYFTMHGGGAQHQALDDLNNSVFGKPIISTTFKASPIPADWRTIGELPLIVSNDQLHLGLSATATTKSTTAPTTLAMEYKVGGLVTVNPVPAGTSLQIDINFRISRAPNDGIVQVFVGDKPMDGDAATGSHELVWLLQNGQAKVYLPDGHSEGTGDKITGPTELRVKLLLNRDLAIIESGGKRLFGGPHQLGSDQPRYIGIRFLRKPGEKWDHIGVTSISVSKP